jgi:hypothetical protein
MHNTGPSQTKDAHLQPWTDYYNRVRPHGSLNWAAHQPLRCRNNLLIIYRYPRVGGMVARWQKITHRVTKKIPTQAETGLEWGTRCRPLLITDLPRWELRQRAFRAG